MTVHALSLRNQIFLQFPEVRRVRFEYEGHTTRFYVDADGTEVTSALKSFLIENHAMGTHVVLADTWVDGPEWPAMYDEFSSAELELIEACDSTKGSLEAVVLQLCRWVADIEIETPRGGHLHLKVEGRAGKPTDALLAECERVVRAAAALPNLHVTVVGERIVRESKPEIDDPKFNQMMRWSENQSSREGIKDDALKQVFDEDEDFFAAARTRAFPSRTARDAGANSPSSIYLPPQVDSPRLAQLLLLYERVYFPASAYTEDEAPDVYGFTRADMLRLIEAGRCIPVLTERIGRLDQKRLRELTDLGRYVGPRRLAARVASHILDANPMWRLPRKDLRVARDVLTEVGRSLQDSSDVPEWLNALTRAWIEFTREGCESFLSLVTNQSTRVPLSFGPGAFAARVLRDALGERAPDLELQLLGMDVSYASALDATYAPVPDERLYPLYELIGQVTSNHHVADVDRLPLALLLPSLIEDLGLPLNDGVDVTTLLAMTNAPTIREVRATFAMALGSPSTLEQAREAARDLAERVRKLDAADAQTATRVEHFEFVGIIADAAAALAHHPPFGSSIVAFLLKHSVPWLWQKLDDRAALREVKVRLAALNHFDSADVVRVQHLRRRLRKSTD